MENSGWGWPPSPLVVEPGWVHVFRLRLDLPPERLAALRALLSPDELARADRYRGDGLGARFTAARGNLRALLAGYAKTSPEQITFETNPHGKPALAGGWLSFNVSHSGALALVAAAGTEVEVGIDIETIRANVEFERLAQRFFAPRETAALLALPPEQRAGAFFACWTRKEAYMKARGLGLAIPLDGFEVSLAPGDPPRLLRPAVDDPHGAAWALWQLDPGPGFTAALCARGPVAGIRCWDWPDVA